MNAVLLRGREFRQKISNPFFFFVYDTEKEGRGSGFSCEFNGVHYLFIPSPASTIS